MKKILETISLRATWMSSVRFLEGEMTLLLIFNNETYLEMGQGENAFRIAKNLGTLLEILMIIISDVTDFEIFRNIVLKIELITLFKKLIFKKVWLHTFKRIIFDLLFNIVFDFFSFWDIEDQSFNSSSLKFRNKGVKNFHVKINNISMNLIAHLTYCKIFYS